VFESQPLRHERAKAAVNALWRRIIPGPARVCGGWVRGWPGVFLSVSVLAAPVWANPAAVNNTRVPPVADRLFESEVAQGARVGMFEAMAMGLRVGLKEKTDKIMQALSVSTPADHSPAKLRAWVVDAGLVGVTGGIEGIREDFDPVLVWNMVALGMEKESAPKEAGGGEPGASLLRTAALAIVTDVREAYWRSATADLLLAEFDALLQEANTVLVQKRGSAGASPPDQAVQNQKILLEMTEKLWKWRTLLVQAKEHLAGLLRLPGGHQAVRVLVAATELQDPGIVTLPVVFLEDHALAQYAGRMNLPKDQWQGSRYLERALLAVFPGYAFNGLGHETVAMAPAGAPSWIEAGKVLTGQMLEGKKGQSGEAEDKVLPLLHGVGTLVQLHLALLDCRRTEKKLTDIREQNKVGQAVAGPRENMDSVVVGVARKADGLILRARQGFAFAENQVALSRLLISLGRDPIPPMPGLEDLAPPTLMANLAFRHESATAALLSALNAGTEPEVEEQLKMMSGSPPSADKGGVWQRMRDFSQKKGLPPSGSARSKATVKTDTRGQPAKGEPVEGEMVPVSAD